MEQSFPARLLA